MNPSLRDKFAADELVKVNEQVSIQTLMKRRLVVKLYWPIIDEYYGGLACSFIVYVPKTDQIVRQDAEAIIKLQCT